MAKVDRTPFDNAAQDLLSDMVERSGMSLRVVARSIGGLVSHVRLGDILNGVKGPVRLSEFILICQACNQDPADALQQIIDTAHAMQQAPAGSPTIDLAHLDPSNPDHVQWIADHPDLFDATAKKGDTQAEQEGMEELP